MRKFKVLNYKKEERTVCRRGLSALYCFAFHGTLMDLHALTLSCFDVSSDDSSRMDEEFSQRICTGIYGCLQLFSILCETAQKLHIRKAREAAAAFGLVAEGRQDRDPVAQRPMYGDDPRDDGIDVDDVDEDPSFLGPPDADADIAPRNGLRVHPPPDDDGAMDVDRDEDEEGQFVKMLGFKDPDGDVAMPDAEDDEEEAGEEELDGGLAQEIDSPDCFVHICRIPANNLILLILSIDNEMLTRDAIHTEFERLYEGESEKEGAGGRGRGRGRPRKEDEPPCCLRDVAEAHRAWADEYAFPVMGATYPDDVFTVLNTARALMSPKSKYTYDFVRALFCDFDDERAQAVFKTDVGANQIRYFRVPDADVYTLPLSQFTQENMARGLLPWLDPILVNFFSRHYGSSEDAFFSPRFLRSLQMPRNMLSKCADPLHQLARYVEFVKKMDDTKMLTVERMRECLLIMETVLENRKMGQFFSPANQAIAQYIRSERQKSRSRDEFWIHGGLMLTERRRVELGIVPDVPSVPAPMPPEAEGDEDGDAEMYYQQEEVPVSYGPLTRFLKEVAPMMNTFLTVPKQYLSFVAILPLLLPNAQDRLNGHHLNITTKGLGQAGKNVLYNRVAMLIAEGIAEAADGWSDKALTTDTPQDGGVIVQNDPKPFLHKDERKLSSRELEELNTWKERLSSAQIVYRALDYRSGEETGGRPHRGLVKTVTPFANCFFWSTNYSSNKGQAMWSRSYHKTVFLNEKFSIVGRQVTAKNLNPEDRTPEVLVETYRQLTTVQMIVMMAISVGILEDVSIGFAVSVMKLVLEEMAAEGLEDCHYPRHFERIFMVTTQLSITRALICKYLDTDDAVAFRYEDLIDLEKELYATKEVLLVSSSWLSEQYIDPVWTSATVELIGQYFHMRAPDYQLTSEDCAEVDRRVNDSVEEMINHVQAMFLTGDDAEDEAAEDEAADLRSSRSAKRRRLADGTSTPASPLSSGEEEAEGNGRVLETLGRKRRSPVVGSGRRGRRERSPIPSPEEMRARAEERRRRRILDVKRNENNHRLKQKNFERSLRRLDSVLIEVVDREQKKERRDTGSAGRLVEFPRYEDGSLVDINYLQVQTTDPEGTVKSSVYWGMRERPNEGDVSHLLELMRKRKHYVPVQFDRLDRTDYNAIRKMYVDYLNVANAAMPYEDDEDLDDDGDGSWGGGGPARQTHRLTREERVDFLRGILEDKYHPAQKVKLLVMKEYSLRLEHSRRNVKRTTMAFHTSLLGRTDPFVIANAIKSQLETKYTIPMRVLCPIPLADLADELGDYGDMKFVDFVPDYNKSEGVYENAAYVEERVAKSYARAKEDYERRKYAVLSHYRDEDPKVSPSQSVDAYVGNEQRPNHVGPVEEVLLIREDIDAYIRRKRHTLVSQRLAVV